MEVYKSLPEGTLAELIDNILYKSPSPISRHQKVLNEVNYELLKLAEESRFGVSEYWIIDPENKFSICYVLDGTRYIVHSEDFGKIESKLLATEIAF